jgi:hypothetical protein
MKQICIKLIQAYNRYITEEYLLDKTSIELLCLVPPLERKKIAEDFLRNNLIERKEFDWLIRNTWKSTIYDDTFIQLQKRMI